jgi:hypothetical protein
MWTRVEDEIPPRYERVLVWREGVLDEICLEISDEDMSYDGEEDYDEFVERLNRIEEATAEWIEGITHWIPYPRFDQAHISEWNDSRIEIPPLNKPVIALVPEMCGPMIFLFREEHCARLATDLYHVYWTHAPYPPEDWNTKPRIKD